MEEKEIGFVSNYFSKISVAAVEITDGTLSVGDTLHFLGNTTDCQQNVDSLQIEHEAVTSAGTGDSVGLKVSEKVKRGDKVYKVVGS